MDIVDRAEWGANPKSLPVGMMALPATVVFLHHSVTEPTSDPAADMRVIERTGQVRFGQISYSYVVHPDGTVLEGCGNRLGSHTAKRNSTSFGICWVGNYNTRSPKAQQIDATRELIADLIRKGWLKPGIYPTGGHRDVANTSCPGDKAYAVLDLLRVPWNPSPSPGGPLVANAPFAAILVHPNGGYLEIGEDGGVFAFGGAPFHGSLGDVPLNQPIVDAAWAPDFEGYVLLGRDGGLFAFGSAQYHGNSLWSGDG